MAATPEPDEVFVNEEMRSTSPRSMTSGKPRAIFFGSPDFAVPCLDAAAEVCEIVLVVCQPDRPAGRGLALRKPAVKVRAEELGVPIAQPTKVRTSEFAQELRGLEAEIGIVVAYGRILPKAVLDAPRRGCVNVHASLLPRWRGAAPIQWSIVAGDRQTGVTLMQMDEGLDTGPILATSRTPIGDDERASELFERLAALGAELLRESLPSLIAGELQPEPQDDANATRAAILKKEDGLLDWSQPAEALHDRIRGLYPWPGAYGFFEGKRVRIHRAAVERGDAATHGEGKVDASTSEATTPPAGTISIDGQDVTVACGEGRLRLLEVQEDGRKRVEASSFAAGKRMKSGAHFDSVTHPDSDEAKR